MGPADILIILAVSAVIAFAVFLIIRRRRRGCGCGCGCEGCTFDCAKKKGKKQ